MRVLILVVAMIATVQVAFAQATPVTDKKFVTLPAVDVTAPENEPFGLLNKVHDAKDGVEQAKFEAKSQPSKALNADCKLTGRYRTCF